MEASTQLPEKLEEALRRGVLNRLPVTILPFLNQQLRDWNFLFPNERRSTERLILYLDSRSPDQSAALFRDLIRLEEQMGVQQWHFSAEEQTIQNSSELARSPRFQEWRKAVQEVFDAADRYEMQAGGPQGKPRNRAIVLDIPSSLPVEEADAWRHWHGVGKRVKLQIPASQSKNAGLDGAFAGLIAHAASSGGPPNSSTEDSSAELWVIDGASGLVDACLAAVPSIVPSNGILLSYTRLDAYRESFSHEMNTMRKNLSDADAVYDHLRKVDVTPWCPAEIAAYPAVREFVRAVYLSGNGAVIFGNSFVEWSASEALRRARPRFLAARFAVRSKPKPFTGVAVFENPDTVNPVPALDDNPGSAIDAQILAPYIWLSAIRYQEYRQSTVCVCVAGNIAEAYVVAPPDFALQGVTEPIPIEAFTDALQTWIA